MNSDDSRGNQNYQHRKPLPHKNSYSPNSVYYGNSGHNSNNQQQQQKKKHHPGHNKGNISNDRLIKQNDTIIKLLKEIRDRLPAVTGSSDADNREDTNQNGCYHSAKSSSHMDHDSIEIDGEDTGEVFDATDDDAFEVENEQN